MNVSNQKIEEFEENEKKKWQSKKKKWMDKLTHAPEPNYSVIDRNRALLKERERKLRLTIF